MVGVEPFVRRRESCRLNANVPATTMDLVPCGFIELDALDRVVCWNETLARWSGIPPGSALGRTLVELFPDEPRIESRVRNVRKLGQPRIYSQLLHHFLVPLRPVGLCAGNPERMQQECRLVPLEDPPGHLGITLIDVTEAVQARDREQARSTELRLAREQAERAIRDREQLYVTHVQREERFRSMVDNLREVVFQTNLDGQWTFLNPVWTEITGIPVEEALGNDALEYLLPEDRDRKSEALRQLRDRPGEHRRLELRYRTEGGGFRWIEELVHPALDRLGRPIGWSGTLDDITERKETEERLHSSGILLDAIRQAQSRFINSTDARSIFAFLLDTVLGITGSEYGYIGEVLKHANGKPYLKTHAISNIAWDEETTATYERLAPTGLEFYRLDTLFGEVLTTGKEVIANDPAVDGRRGGLPPGHPALKAFLGLPFFYDGELIGSVGMANRAGGYDQKLVEFLRPFLSTCAQVTNATRLAKNRREAEEALRDSESRFRQLAENIEEVFWMTNAGKSELLYVSPAYERVWGRTCASLYRNPEEWIQSIHPEDRARVLEAAHSRQSDGTYREEYRVVRPNGTVRWVLDCAFPIRNEAGEVFRLVGVAQDITERHQAESALVEARDAAEAGSKAKSEFMAKMSHEIRTPLNGVLGFAELLLESNLDDQQRESALVIRESGSALMEIINDILDFSKMEAGRLEIQHVAFHPLPIVAGVLKLFEAAVRKKGIELRCQEFPTGSLALTGDPGRFRQIVTNLVGNAVKFTEQGCVEIALTPAPASAGGSQAESRFIKVRVTDTGIGIPVEKQGLLFHEFSQVDGSTTRKYGGTGLGLAICKRLAELMGGSIGCESGDGRGSTFWFTMPESNEPVAAVPEVIPERPLPPEDRAYSNRPRRVLLAEDNQTNQLLASRLLWKLGCDVVAARTGIEVVEIVARGGFDIVLMDCHMPEMDGFEAAAAIRQGTDPSAGIPIVALTASAFEEDRQKCLKVGMNDFLTKPISKEQLSAALDRWCPTVAD